MRLRHLTRLLVASVAVLLLSVSAFLRPARPPFPTAVVDPEAAPTWAEWLAGHPTRDPIRCHMTYMSPHYVDVPLATLPAGYRLALYRDRGEDGRDAVVWRHTAAGPGAAPGGPTASARATRIALFVPGNAGSRGQVRSLASESSRMVRALGSSPAAAASPEAPWWDHVSWLGRHPRPPAQPSPASPASPAYAWDSDPEAIDWFTLDFNEAWAAFSPHLLQLQAEALNQAIRFLIDDYAARRVARPPVGVAPTRPDADAHHHHHPNDNDNVNDNVNDNDAALTPLEIIVVGHSMGGVVARLAPLLDSYPQHAVHVLVTLATPHRRPPIATSRGLLQIYDAIQRGWNDPAEAEGDAVRRVVCGAGDGDGPGAAPEAGPPATDAALDAAAAPGMNPFGIAHVSLGSGNQDQLIPMESTRLAPVWGPDDTAMGAAATCDTMQFSTATTALMGAWTAADHLGIIWCHQVMRVVLTGLLHALHVPVPAAPAAKDAVPAILRRVAVQRIHRIREAWLRARWTPGEPWHAASAASPAPSSPVAAAAVSTEAAPPSSLRRPSPAADDATLGDPDAPVWHVRSAFSAPWPPRTILRPASAGGPADNAAPVAAVTDASSPVASAAYVVDATAYPTRPDVLPARPGAPFVERPAPPRRRAAPNADADADTDTDVNPDYRWHYRVRHGAVPLARALRAQLGSRLVIADAAPRAVAERARQAAALDLRGSAPPWRPWSWHRWAWTQRRVWARDAPSPSTRVDSPPETAAAAAGDGGTSDGGSRDRHSAPYVGATVFPEIRLPATPWMQYEVRLTCLARERGAAHASGTAPGGTPIPVHVQQSAPGWETKFWPHVPPGAWLPIGWNVDPRAPAAAFHPVLTLWPQPPPADAATRASQRASPSPVEPECATLVVEWRPHLWATLGQLVRSGWTDLAMGAFVWALLAFGTYLVSATEPDGRSAADADDGGDPAATAAAATNAAEGQDEDAAMSRARDPQKDAERGLAPLRLDTPHNDGDDAAAAAAGVSSGWTTRGMPADRREAVLAGMRRAPMGRSAVMRSIDAAVDTRCDAEGTRMPGGGAGDPHPASRWGTGGPAGLALPRCPAARRHHRRPVAAAAAAGVILLSLAWTAPGTCLRGTWLALASFAVFWLTHLLTATVFALLQRAPGAAWALPRRLTAPSVLLCLVLPPPLVCLAGWAMTLQTQRRHYDLDALGALLGAMAPLITLSVLLHVPGVIATLQALIAVHTEHVDRPVAAVATLLWQPGVEEERWLALLLLLGPAFRMPLHPGDRLAEVDADAGWRAMRSGAAAAVVSAASAASPGERPPLPSSAWRQRWRRQQRRLRVAFGGTRHAATAPATAPERGLTAWLGVRVLAAHRPARVVWTRVVAVAVVVLLSLSCRGRHLWAMTPLCSVLLAGLTHAVAPARRLRLLDRDLVK
ncbi:hypothetical protein CXG81DRAFT_19379 [Caulochytrium protostelioides]|uniref:GPI inositol-deacylase n=1 Tax=Caulochytrium protostelioides TaxID=1555241 RepID=A0A4P9X6C0_9FUNG|nr:hypothetical protein CXG81DRAFT_19379 [Caulochytrium protostelioides]|eukprot:RKP00724.1 hypothetical protein CXG81DRAFT_19379 [Caulochytrium protostelioides]